LLFESFPTPPARDTAISRAILTRVSDGVEPETLRLHRPGRLVAFGPLDRLEPGYVDAIAAAADRGFGAVERLAGGRAAVFHEGTLAFAWITPEQSPATGIARRFGEVTRLITAALLGLGVDARVGEVPGEYCPGEYSVNARGRTKLVGIGQRLVARAAHVGGVIVVEGAGRLREVLVPVYLALNLDWDPGTVGSVEDETGPVSWEGVRDAIVDAFSDRYTVIAGAMDPATLALAERLEPLHVPAS
jgi:lipoate-protein ligase A